MKARPGINGNTAADFQEHGRKIYDAVRQLDKALTDALAEVTHGRNYQHLPLEEAKAAREEDVRRLAKHKEAVAAMSNLAWEIDAASHGVDATEPEGFDL